MARKIELELLNRGIYTIAVGYPVMEIGTARMRCIITMGHTDEMIDRAIKTFKEVAEDFGFFEFIKTYEQNLQARLKRYFIVNWIKSWFVPQEQ